MPNNSIYVECSDLWRYLCIVSREQHPTPKIDVKDLVNHPVVLPKPDPQRLTIPPSRTHILGWTDEARFKEAAVKRIYKMVTWSICVNSMLILHY